MRQLFDKTTYLPAAGLGLTQIVGYVLTTTENKISFARQAYNDAVMVFNTKRETFPTNIVASMFNFSQASLFEIEDEAQKEAPKVSFE